MSKTPPNTTPSTNSSAKIRIAKHLAACGIGSRRGCERLIQNGEITLNNQIVTSPAINIDPEHDVVCYKGNEVRTEQKAYYILNKPRGYTCTNNDRHAAHIVSELFPPNAGRLFTIGRLDCDSEGLIICTNDGELADQVAHPRHGVLKTYLVWIEGAPTEKAFKELSSSGIVHRQERLKAKEVNHLSSKGNQHQLQFIIGEGKKREIRRMCAYYNWDVKRLLRTSIGPLELGNLKPGKSRPLSQHELQALKACIK